MAKTTVTVAVLLLLFAVAQARFSPDLEKRSVNEEEVVTVFPESDSKATESNNFLILPTEKPEIETESVNPRVFEWDLENSDAKLTESETSEGETTAVDTAVKEETVESEDSESDSDSDSDSSVVTVISFRPRNRHFRRLPFPFPFRGGHRCHHRRGEHVFRPEEGRSFRGYGNDMISSEEGEKFETEPREDLPRLVPGRWMRFGHGDDMRMHHHHRFEHPEDMDMHHDRDHDHHHEHEHDFEHHHEHDHEHHHEHEQPSDFVSKIRKFLNF